MYEELDGIDVTFKSNYKYADLLQHFISKIPTEAIRLDTKVQKVTQKGNKINLQLGEDELLETDFVIFMKIKFAHPANFVAMFVIQFSL